MHPHDGARSSYAALLELADPRFPDNSQGMSYASAGKLMALAAIRQVTTLDAAEKELLSILVDN
jgi:hypothetical protein